MLTSKLSTADGFSNRIALNKANLSVEKQFLSGNAHGCMHANLTNLLQKVAVLASLVTHFEYLPCPSEHLCIMSCASPCVPQVGLRMGGGVWGGRQGPRRGVVF